MKSVLILSKLHYGNVPLFAEQLRARGVHSVLVSELPDNRHRGTCDEHVLVDWWQEDPATLTARLDALGIEPIGILNMLESLSAWHLALAEHYDIPGSGPSRALLVSKVLVRERMRALGLSDVEFTDDPATLDFFPAIVKPSRDSGASTLVSRVDGVDDVRAYLDRLDALGLAGTELIAEEYLPGTEFSVDGPVVSGRFHPMITVEKPEHDDLRHHDAGLEFHPPEQPRVQDAVRIMCERIDAFCAALELDQVWLHFEGRACDDGRAELIEINPRLGGGLIPSSLLELTGLDPVEAFVSMALGQFTLDEPLPLRERPVVGWIDLEAHELGTVRVHSTDAELRALPGVFCTQITDGYRITDLERENFFLRFAVTADSWDELRARVAHVRDSVVYSITETP